MGLGEQHVLRAVRRKHGIYWSSLHSAPTSSVVVAVSKIINLIVGLKPLQDLTMTITRTDGSTQQVPLTLRIDTAIEVDYLKHGGILPYVLRQILAEAA